MELDRGSLEVKQPLNFNQQQKRKKHLMSEVRGQSSAVDCSLIGRSFRLLFEIVMFRVLKDVETKEKFIKKMFSFKPCGLA